MWVDDRRNPLVYLKKKPEAGKETLQANLDFYKNFMSKYRPQFMWVKSFDEFKNHIMKNGLPDFVSFDRDLGKGLPNGEACASWLVEYCNEKGLRLPKYYAHTANKNGKRNINAIMKGQQTVKIGLNEISEIVQSVINEIGHSVYLDRSKINDKNKTIGLTYNNKSEVNRDNDRSTDMLKTDKMDKDGGSENDVYLVTLKNGLKCYNITSINGTEVMHYFKRKWDNQSTSVKVDDEDYKVNMMDDEERRFLDRFKKKVGMVVNYHVARFNREGNSKVSAISIYPVKSSSNFNDKMAELLEGDTINGLTVQKISSELLVKDMREFGKDEDFIKKNEKYYGEKFTVGDTDTFGDQTVGQRLHNSVSKYQTIYQFAEKAADTLNKLKKRIVTRYYQLSFKHGGNIPSAFENVKLLAKDYAEYCKIIFNAGTLTYGTFDNDTKRINFSLRKNGTPEKFFIIRPVVKTKGRNPGGTLESILSLIGNYIENFIGDNILSDMAKHSHRYELRDWEPVPFQIKNLSNGERMGVKGIYNINKDEELVNRERERARGTAFVIFDDNVSGGATLSDVCRALKENGFDNLIPITFGVMPEKWVFQTVRLTKPTDNGGKGFNF